MPGVGTEFKEIGEHTESSEGKAFALGGQARIIYGLLQVLNAVHMTVRDQDPLYKDDVVGQLAQAYGREVGRAKPISRERHVAQTVTHRDWFEPHLAKLKAVLTAHPKPAIPSLTVSVFGFSRGGAQAVAFCHLLDKLLDGGCLAGIATTVNFLGVFDVVASVGGSASVAKTTPMPGMVFDGQWAWANCIDEPLPGCVTGGLHLVAAHEMRMNFPVTRQSGSGFAEQLYPGAHSDVGGGYAPGEQGKARQGQGSLLSQIPLCHMYMAARAAGVPLMPYSEMSQAVKNDFAIDPQLASAWQAYIAALGPQNGSNLKAHMRLFYRWLAQRLHTLEQTDSFKAGSPQDQEDLRSANVLLQGDLQALRYRRHPPAELGNEDDRTPAFGQDMRLRMNQWQRIRANSKTPLDEWERFALGCLEQADPLPPDVARFFDDHVHDSFASFYLAGEVTEFDKRCRTAKVMATRDPSRLNRYEKKIYAKAMQVQEAQARQAKGEVLSEEEVALVKEAEYGTPYPVMKDEDAGDMLGLGEKVAIGTQSATRREGGGYVLRRDYFPQTGFVRRSVHEAELMHDPAPPLPEKSRAQPSQQAFATSD